MITKSTLHAFVEQLNRLGAGFHLAHNAEGYAVMVEGQPLSPRLSTREMYYWLTGYATCLRRSTENATVSRFYLLRNAKGEYQQSAVGSGPFLSDSPEQANSHRQSCSECAESEIVPIVRIDKRLSPLPAPDARLKVDCFGMKAGTLLLYKGGNKDGGEFAPLSDLSNAVPLDSSCVESLKPRDTGSEVGEPHPSRNPILS